MTLDPKQSRELTMKIMAALDGKLDDESLNSLAREVHDNPDSQQYYIELMAVHSLLRQSRGFMSSLLVTEDTRLDEIGVGSFRDTVDKDLQDITIRRVLSGSDKTGHGNVSVLVRPRRKITTREFMAVLGRLAAILALCLSVLWFDRWLLRNVPVPKGGVEVAILSKVCQARWIGVGPEGMLKEGISLTNRTYQLQEGWAQINMDQGAEVILQAPATISLETANRVFLHQGTLTARITPEAHGFTVRSNLFCAVDYGTEFGMQISDSGGIETHIFAGNVDLRTGSDPLVFDRSQRIRAGYAAQAKQDGEIVVSELINRPRLFIRELPQAGSTAIPGRSIDLADVIGQGNGLGTGHRDWSINMFTGHSGPKPRFVNNDSVKDDSETMPSRERVDRTILTAVQDNPFVDCLIIPKGAGEAPISTAGHVWDDCPQSSGEIFQQITNSNPLSKKLSLNDITYGTPDKPGFYMHSTTGVTFDLVALRQALPGISFKEFQTYFGIDDNQIISGRVGLNILVDGIERFAIEGELRGANPISVLLKPDDRFLTIFVTDGGDGTGGDRCVFGKPCLLVQ